MATVILFDTCRVINSKIDENTTIKDILQQGVLSFLKQLHVKSNHMSLIAIMPLNGKAPPIMSFTRDYKILESSLMVVEAADLPTSNIFTGVKSAIALCEAQLGHYTAVQFVLVTWIENPFSYEPHCTLSSTSCLCAPSLQVPFDFKIHVVSYGTAYRPNGKNPLQALALNHMGSFFFFNVEEDHDKHLKWQFQRLLQSHYQCTKGYRLLLGHLKTPLELVPNPTISLWNYKAARHGLPFPFPENLCIIGFVPQRLCFSLPCVTRFALLPTPLSTTLISPLETSSVPSPLLYLLLEQLSHTHKAAVVRLGEHWHGLIHINYQPLQPLLTTSSEFNHHSSGGTMINQTSSLLVLTVLDRFLHVEWLGPLDQLVIQSYQSPSSKTSPPLYPLPLFDATEPWPSYNPALENEDDFIFPMADPNALQLEITRLNCLVADLPNQCVAVFNQCEYIRQLTKKYHMDHVLETIVDRLVSDMNKRTLTTLTGKILQQLKTMVYKHAKSDKPIEWKQANEQTSKSTNHSSSGKSNTRTLANSRSHRPTSASTPDTNTSHVTVKKSASIAKSLAEK